VSDYVKQMCIELNSCSYKIDEQAILSTYTQSADGVLS